MAEFEKLPELSLIDQFKKDLASAHSKILDLEKELHKKNQLIDTMNDIITRQQEMLGTLAYPARTYGG